MREARQLHPDFDLTRSWALNFVPPKDGDEPLTDYLRGLGFSDDQIQYTRRSWANAACEALERISAAASIQDMTDTTAGEGDFRILAGYDTLIEHVAAGLEIHLNTVVKRIDWSGSDVRVEASNAVGDLVYRADRVVIALPLGVLQSGKVIFSPALPAEKQDAIDRLIMGVAIKLLYVFDQRVLPSGIGAFYSPHNPPMWWSPTFTREVNGEAITAFATGDWARELIALGDEAALQAGLDVLRRELGLPDLQPIASHFMNWAAEEFSLGGYSVVPVGGMNLRAQIAEPVNSKLFWAGEHTAKNPWAATVHGAYASGKRAASEILNKAD